MLNFKCLSWIVSFASTASEVPSSSSIPALYLYTVNVLRGICASPSLVSAKPLSFRAAMDVSTYRIRREGFEGTESETIIAGLAMVDRSLPWTVFHTHFAHIGKVRSSPVVLTLTFKSR